MVRVKTLKKIKIKKMKHFLLLFFLVSSVVTSAQYSLVWSDEFDGTSIDLSKWSHDIGQGVWGWGNNELQYYTNSAANSTVDGGYLKITARDETFGSANYTSAKLKTKDLYEFTYGKVEARIKVPFGQGLWPAFWMLGANIDQVSWPYCGEIDKAHAPVSHVAAAAIRNQSSALGATYFPIAAGPGPLSSASASAIAGT